MVLARYVGYFVPMGDMATRGVAAGAIGLLTFVNYGGVTHGGRVQALFTAAKLAAIAIIIVAGLIVTPHAMAAPTMAETSAPIAMRPFLLALVAGLFAYGGWHMVTYAAGETRNAARTIPRALLIGTLIVTVCYAGLNTIYLRVLPLDAVRASTRIAADAADALFGGGGAGLMAALVILSTFGAVNGIILAGPRVYFSMASDGLIFKGLGVVHPRFQTPHRAILLQGAWSAVLALTNSYGTLVRRVVCTEWVFFAMLAIGLILLRRRADYRPSYRVWGYPVVPVLFAVASLVVVVQQMIAQPRESAIGLAMVLVGLPIYFLWSRPGARRVP
jgi:APA family basic amino acid/polyamine antiporter